ncbi:MAG: transpeptidase family protein [Allisonella histaminiformans]|uniref:penicillin-binding protein n=1 Tax=Allisonella histaminiformans TaxID=209880 RepID=UPI0023553175|nr:penicillin-binding transpeptidase domain-containing protein [Allisonella histaminiformans]MCI6002911.1 transpeptidase family protein [Allisonella histaminiformans]
MRRIIDKKMLARCRIRGKRIIRSRLSVLMSVFLITGGILALRLTYVQGVSHNRYMEMGKDQIEETQILYSPRGTIYDRNGNKLAFSVQLKSLYADPKMMEISPKQAAKLFAPVLKVPEADLVKKFSKDTHFVWLERVMDPEDCKAAEQLIDQHHLKGFGFIDESRRYYPNDEMLANVLGFVGRDDKGLDGLEMSLDKEIRGSKDKQILITDIRGVPILRSSMAPYMAPKGKSVYLTIDQNIQYFAERALDRAMGTTQAQSGLIIVMDPKTGAILAMASRPTYDPNNFNKAEPAQFRNKAVVDIYEPGSTFKPIVAATALSAGTYDTTRVWHDPGAIWANGHAVRNWDKQSYGDVRLVDILKFSINTGCAHIGLLTGGETLTSYAKAFGFGKPTGIELPGEGAGILFNPKKMRPLDVATMSIGQSIAVTPLQMVQAYSALANDGKMVKPHLISSIKNADGTDYYVAKPQIVSNPVDKKVADQVKDMMEKEISEGGGLKAQVPGYHMGGKTGTAQKLDTVHGGYLPNQYIASFCGFGPVEDPKAICLVVLDSPRGTYYGGQIAAPVFSEAMGQIMRYLGVPTYEDKAIHAAPVTEPAREMPELPSPNADTVVLPGFYGWSIRDTGEWLNKAGLRFRPEGSGFGISQSPGPGSTVKRGETVTVTFKGH